MERGFLVVPEFWNFKTTSRGVAKFPIFFCRSISVPVIPCPFFSKFVVEWKAHHISSVTEVRITVYLPYYNQEDIFFVQKPGLVCQKPGLLFPPKKVVLGHNFQSSQKETRTTKFRTWKRYEDAEECMASKIQRFDKLVPQSLELLMYPLYFQDTLLGTGCLDFPVQREGKGDPGRDVLDVLSPMCDVTQEVIKGCLYLH